MRVILRGLLLAGLSLATALAGDFLTVTSKVSGRGPVGKTEGTQVQYFSSTKMRITHADGKMDSLIDYDAGVMYTILHDKKKIQKMSFKDLAEALEGLEQQMSGMPEMVTKMLVGDISETKVEKLGKDTVAGRPCDKVRVTVGKLTQEMSLDPALKVPIDYAKAMQMIQRVPGPTGVAFKKMYAAFAKLKGFPLKSRVTGIMGLDQTTEATAISTAALPASTFALPDYPVEDVGKKMKEDMARGRH